MNNGFRYFAEPLFNRAVKTVGIPTLRFFGMSKFSESFYSIKDGAWSDVTIWETTGGRPATRVPSTLDDVYIKSFVTTTGGACNDLYIIASQSLTLTSGTTTVNGNIQCQGYFNGGTGSLNLYGNKNHIDKNYFTAGTGTVNYVRPGDQLIMDLPYHNLSSSLPAVAKGYKTLTADLNITGNLLVSSSGSGSPFIQNTNLYLDFAHYDVFIGGTTTLVGSQSVSHLYKKATAGNNSITFVGLVSLSYGNIDFTSNPTVEFRGGLTNSSGGGSGIYHTWGTGLIKFTTNNQNVTNQAGAAYVSEEWYDVLIEGPITVTLMSTSNNPIQINNSIDGTVAGSKWENKGSTWFNYVGTPMPTAGTFDKDSFSTNQVGYIYNGSGTLPYTTHGGSVYITGTGIKTQAAGVNTIGTSLVITTIATYHWAGNTTIGGVVSLAGIMDCLSYDGVFNGQVNVTGGGNTAYFKKTGGGNLQFNALLNGTGAGSAAGFFDFTGNPTVETKAGFNTTRNGVSGGTGQWTATTNNQSWSHPSLQLTNLQIVGSITLTNAVGSQVQFLNTLSGTVIGSTWSNLGVIYFSHATNITMSGGTFIHSAVGNTVGYNANATYTLPYSTYHHLILGGTGIKTTLGATTLNGNLSQSTGTIQLAGNMTVVGAVSGQDINLGVYNLEVQGVSYFSRYTFGTGTLIWSVNNKNIGTSGTANMEIYPNVLISGAITVNTFVSITAYQFHANVDGNNVASQWTASAGSVFYRGAAMPMLTGVLNANSAANIFYYDRAGDQDVKGGNPTALAYRTLMFSNSGVKTLQGNVSRTGGSTTGTASVNLNGFTIT